jgi:4-methylaminobutanoate oxidase (formaldehyde-forming)
MALAEWVARGEPPYDLWPVDIRRFGRPHFDTDWVRTRTMEAYGKHYTIAWPSEEHTSGRPCRRSPLYQILKRQGACFGEKLGWERPNWYADLANGEKAEDRYSFGRPNWFEAVGREHRAGRNAAVLIDQTSFAKFMLVGPDAESALTWICANDIAKPVGRVVYTQMLNERGGIECDLTVTRTGPDSFYIVTGTGFATHDFDWIRRNISAGANAQLIDVTSSNAVLSLMGPKSRDILASVTRTDVSNAAFSFGTAQRIGIAGAPVLALRVTYVGELGWELHFPVEYAVNVYETLMAAGMGHGIRNAGYRTIETMRLEKGYRAWAGDIGPDFTPLEAGMGWAVKLRKNVDFKGRKAIEAQKANGMKKFLACFTIDDPAVILLGRETILRDGKPAGWLSSAGWGYTVAKNIGFGYVRSRDGVDAAYVSGGRYELEVATERMPCAVTLEPLYDPKMARIKA